MNSAIGNFDSAGNVVKEQQMPENGYTAHNVEWCASKIQLLEDELIRINKQVILMNGTPVVNEPTNAVLDALDYVSKDEWEILNSLIIFMLANGASLFELQQRLMGFSE